MKLREAYGILELPTTATPEEAKKRYRELAKKHHPDVNKEPEAEATFKKISEAYQAIQAGINEPEPWVGDISGFNNRTIYDIFNRSTARTNKRYYTTNIELNTTISFKQAVQGCKIEIAYSRQIKCPHCQGNGNKPVNNGCKTCGGQGQVVNRNGSTVFLRTCPDCQGRSQSTPCTECNSTGVMSTQSSLLVTVRPGVVDGDVLGLQGMGNFSGTFMGLQDTYTDLHLRVKVTPELGLRLEGKDVVSDLHLSLLDALRGCTCIVHTIDGNKEIEIMGGIKNKEEMVLSVGDHNNIKHRIIFNVRYPDNVSKLIDTLRKEEN
jgi:molecular chaperone DnaJ